jgi:hypothetical protein
VASCGIFSLVVVNEGVLSISEVCDDVSASGLSLVKRSANQQLTTRKRKFTGKSLGGNAPLRVPVEV